MPDSDADDRRRASRAAIASIGDELLAGDVADANSGWIGRELDELGYRVLMIATLPDNRPSIARFVEWARREHEVVVTAGGLGGTPDDVTRDAVADAFGVERVADGALVRAYDGVPHAAPFVEEWCRLPDGSRPLAGAAGGAPAFVLENVYVLPGVPEEMQAAFASARAELRSGPPRSTWRRLYTTSEDRIAAVLREMAGGHADVEVGSYPRFRGSRKEVEIVIRSRGDAELAAAVSRIERLLADAGVEPAREEPR